MNGLFFDYNNRKKVYYGLTDSEVRSNNILYKRDIMYDGKGVNLSLRGLRKFIKNSNIDDVIKHYTIIPISEFTVLDHIDYDDKYDMITVKTPFNVKITNVHKL